MNRLLAVGVILLVIAVSLGAAIFYANPPLPTFTTTPSLKARPESKISPALNKLMAVNSPIKLQQGKLLAALRKQILSGTWIPLPQAQALVKHDASFLSAFEKAMKEPHCFPLNSSNPDTPNAYSLLSFLHAQQVMMVRAIVQLQQGQHEVAVKHLLWQSQRLLRYEKECQVDIISEMIFVVMSHFLQRTFLFALQTSNVSVAQQISILRAIKQWEDRPNSIVDALRYEAQAQIDYMRHMKKYLATSVSKGTKKPRGADTRMSWPYFDAEQTAQLAAESWRCVIRQALASPIKHMKTSTCSVQQYLKKLSKQGKFYWKFRYNAVGKILLSVAAPSFIKYATKWHQSRCYASVVRTMWLRSLSKEVRSTLPASVRTEPLNPMTGKSFPSLKGVKKICFMAKSSGLLTPVIPSKR